MCIHLSFKREILWLLNKAGKLFFQPISLSVAFITSFITLILGCPALLLSF